MTIPSENPKPMLNQRCGLVDIVKSEEEVIVVWANKKYAERFSLRFFTRYLRPKYEEDVINFKYEERAIDGQIWMVYPIKNYSEVDEFFRKEGMIAGR